jgi:imidazolonepropionase-like amidohydrolase
MNQAWLGLIALASSVLTHGQTGGVTPAARQTLLITHATLWTRDGLLQDRDILIQNGHVAAIGEPGQLDRPTGVRTLDAGGDTLLPGLIDSHVHLSLGTRAPKEFGATAISAATGRQLLRSGVTSGRIHLSDLPSASKLRKDSADDAFPSPRFSVGGPGLFGGQPTSDNPNGNVWGVKSAADAVQKVRLAKDAGSDWIALHDLLRFKEGELDALVAEARRLRLRLMAGGNRIAEVEKAVELGVDSIEYLDSGATANYSAELVARLQARGKSLFMVPQVGFPHRFVAYRHGTMPLDDPRLTEFMPPEVAAFVSAALHDDRTKEISYGPRWDAVPPSLPDKFRQLRAAGLQLVVGTDCGSPAHFHADSIWWEMETWRNLGVPPHEIVRAATELPARMLHQTDVGHLGVGARGDFVLYRGQIADGPFTVERVRAVAKGGRLFVEDGRWVGPAIEKPPADAVVREFHTTAGPLQLTITGATVTGKYRISVLPKPEEGTFAGTLKDGLVDAVWTEPGKSGRLLLAFTADFSRFHAVYNAGNRPEHWFGDWIGVNAKNLDAAPAELRARLRSDW